MYVSSKMADIKHVFTSAWLFLIGVTILGVSGNRQQQQGRATQNVGALPTSEVNMNDFAGFIPTAPSPENVNCYFDVTVMQTIGGQCVRFGRSQMWSCQSGVHVELSPECGRLNRRRPQRRPNNQRP